MTAPTDPHDAHWQAIAEAAQKINVSLNCTADQAGEFCHAIDRLSAALMGEAEEDRKLLDWMQAHRASVEWTEDLEDPSARVTTPRHCGERVLHAWRGSLRQAIQQAVLGMSKPAEFNSGDLMAAMMRDGAGS